MNNRQAEIAPDQLAIFRALAEALLDEMGEALRQGAFSQNIKERKDYSCALFDPDGNLVCGAAHIPVHLGSMDTACKAAIDAVPMKPGDAVILNDPWSGGTHLPDITIIFPSFHGSSGSPGFYLGVRAHHSDVGGIAPGSLPLSKSLVEEGFVIQPQLILRSGEIMTALVEDLARTSRQGDERKGDLKAQLAAGAVGLKRLDELARSRGVDIITAEASALISHSSMVLENYLSEMPEGNGHAVCTMDEIPGEPGAVIDCRLKLQHDPTPHLEIDFSNSSDRHPGCLNAVPAIARSAVIYTLRLFLPDDTPVTSGLLEPVSIVLRDGSILNPPEGAAVAGGNVETSQAIVEAFLLALGNLGWEIPAASQGTMNNILLGNPPHVTKEKFSFYETIGGGAGATHDKHGASAIQTHMTNTRNTPIEALEREYPLRVVRYGIRSGSGGKGLKNGGEGIVREFKVLNETRLTILSHHRTLGPPGVNGGQSGMPGRNVLIRKGKETELPARVMIDLEPGDIIRIETPGAGGYGEPE